MYISIERGKNSLTESQSSFAATIKRSERQREGEREREREREGERERERERVNELETANLISRTKRKATWLKLQSKALTQLCNIVLYD